MARTIVTKVGMSEKIGHVNFSENEYGMKTYSDATNKVKLTPNILLILNHQIIDDEVKRILDECTEKTRKLVKEKRDLIKGLSDLLLEKETIDLKQIVSVLGERPFQPKENYRAYLEEVIYFTNLKLKFNPIQLQQEEIEKKETQSASTATV